MGGSIVQKENGSFGETFLSKSSLASRHKLFVEPSCENGGIHPGALLGIIVDWKITFGNILKQRGLSDLLMDKRGKLIDPVAFAQA